MTHSVRWERLIALQQSREWVIDAFRAEAGNIASIIGTSAPGRDYAAEHAVQAS